MPAPDTLEALVQDLGKVPRSLQKHLRPRLKQAAEPIAAEARRRAGEWSERIPRAIQVRPSFSQRSPGVRVVVSRKRAPHARAFEGIGRKNRGPTFRHPVFADQNDPRSAWTWVTQQRRPFLMPAVEAGRPRVIAAVSAAVADAARESGFR